MNEAVELAVNVPGHAVSSQGTFFKAMSMQCNLSEIWIHSH